MNITRRNAIRLGGAVLAGSLTMGAARRPAAVLESSKVGNPMPDGYDVVIHARNADEVTLAVSGPDGRIVMTPVAVNSDGYATVPVRAKSAHSRYTHDVQLRAVDGSWETYGTGSGWTAPTPYEPVGEYRIAAWGCQHRRPGTRVYSHMTSFDAHLAVMLGDIGYDDITSRHYEDHLAARERQFALIPDLANYYANTAHVTEGSDHDWEPGNKTFGTNPWTEPSITAYKMAFPHLPIPLSQGQLARCGTMMAGRTRLIFADTRSGRRTAGSTNQDPNQTAYGYDQATWIVRLLEDAARNPDVRGVVLAQDFVWGGRNVHKHDASCRYRYEREHTIGPAMAAVIAAGKSGTIIQGDNHGGVGDDGSNNPYGGWKVFGCCGVDSKSGNIAGDQRYQHEWPARGKHQPIELYGRVTLTDDGAPDSAIDMKLELVDALADVVRFTV